MSIPVDSGCLLCYINKYVPMARSLGDEDTATAFSRELIRMFLELPEGASSPAMGPATAALLQRYYGLDPDRFREEKRQSNEFVLSRLDAIREKVRAAADPVLAGLQFSILGNYLDFAALGSSISFEKLEDMLDKALEMDLDPAAVADFKAELEAGRTLLYLTDNAGEIGFDRVFAEVLKERYPHLEITFCVRGGISQNDATREDAAVVGIPFPVIDNGNTVAGTELPLLSREAKQAMDEADVILSKGMGNTETLYGCGYPIYYAFLIKCEKFVRLFGKPMMTPMFVKERK